MNSSLRSVLILLALFLLPSVYPSPTRADQDGWLDLSRLDAWKTPHGEWFLADSVQMDPKNPRKLVAEPGKSILVNGPKGRSRDLVSKQSFRDIEIHVEFMIPKKSNSGVKFEELYEIQILDSYGKKKVTGDDCGGIYPRAENKPKYHHIDEGIPPRVNACRPAGEWQTLDAIFLAPRFDASGKKIANAKVVKAVLNGQLIHENVELKTPTGANWTKKEPPSGRLLLQGDHGPVAFRNIRVRPL
jgi:hypothetical protein